MIFRIVDSRYWAGLPMIITTNLTKQDLLSPRSVTKKRIYDRILDRCCPIEMTGTNRRVKAMRNSILEMKQPAKTPYQVPSEFAFFHFAYTRNKTFPSLFTYSYPLRRSRLRSLYVSR